MWRIKSEFEILGSFIDLQISVITEFFQRFQSIRVPFLMWENPLARSARRNNHAKLHIYKSCSGLSGYVPAINFFFWLNCHFLPPPHPLAFFFSTAPYRIICCHKSIFRSILKKFNLSMNMSLGLTSRRRLKIRYSEISEKCKFFRNGF